MKKILFSAYSLEVGGIETALITLLKKIHTKYQITLVLEKKEGIFLKDVPEDVKIMTYVPSKIPIKIIRKAMNFIKQQNFKRKYKNQFNFSACYATYSYSASFVARTTSKNSCLWVHNDYFHFYDKDENKYKEFFEKLKIEKFQKIVFVSEKDENVFIEYFPEYKKRCWECNNLINNQLIQKQAEEKISDFEKQENLLTFIHIGRHDEKQKRISRIIKATKRLNEQGYHFRVILVGEGENTSDYKEQAKEISNIEFLGAKKNPYPYLEKSDCMVLSSDYEGYPVVFIESLILGKPIITTEVSDSKKDIQGKFGIVVEKSEEGIYQGMKQYLDHGFLMQPFDVEKYNENILKKLEEIIK